MTAGISGCFLILFFSGCLGEIGGEGVRGFVCRNVCAVVSPPSEVANSPAVAPPCYLAGNLLFRVGLKDSDIFVGNIHANWWCKMVM